MKQIAESMVTHQENTGYKPTQEQLREKDKKLHKALCKILKEILRSDPASGLGKSLPLMHILSGLWSKRISQKDRLIYKFDDKNIYIFAIGGHYDQH